MFGSEAVAKQTAFPFTFTFVNGEAMWSCRSTQLNCVSLLQMRGSLPRLAARVISKSEAASQNASRVFPAPLTSKEPRVTTLNLLLQQKSEAGGDYPANIRLEPPLVKTTLARVPADIRTELTEYLRER